MPARKMGVLFVGSLGSVATTAVAGTWAIRKGLAPVRGLVTEARPAAALPLLALDDISFGGWDIRSGDLYSAAVANMIISGEILAALRKELQAIPVYQGIRTNVDAVTKQVYGVAGEDKKTPLMTEVEKLISDIRHFKAQYHVSFIVVINVASTEPPASPHLSNWDLTSFEREMRESNPQIAPSMIYAYAALHEGCGYVNFTPSVCAELPALIELAMKKGVPVAGKDGKTGQTLYKTVLASMFKARQLKVTGWYSTNILGNTDGEVLRHQQHGRTKLETKSIGLRQILGYDDFEHLVRIDYYPPRGDHKEAWDNIDFEGWAGQRMSMKINWIGCDSALAAPLLLDLARLVEYAARRGEKGILHHLAMFFKAPYGKHSEISHDFFTQLGRFDQYVKECLEKKG